MGAYRPLFNVSIEHAYFADLSCKSLEFVPTHASASLLNRAGLLLKPSKNGISIFYEEDKMDVLRLHAEDDFVLAFKVFSKDPYFSSYTLPLAKNDNMILCFNNQQITKEEAILNANVAKFNFAIYKASLKPQVDLNARIPNYSKSFGEVVQPNGSILFKRF